MAGSVIIIPMTEKLKGIAGSMAAGKTGKLIELAKRAELAKKNVLAFKPKIDTRWDMPDFLVSREKNGEVNKTYPAHSVGSAQEIVGAVLHEIEQRGKLDYVIIDEVQLFDDSIIEVVRYLIEADIKVVFAGLATDFRGEPFGPMPFLLAISDEIERLTAICNYEDENGICCGLEATRTQREINGTPANYYDPIIVIGDNEYKARCPSHHIVPGKPKPKTK